MANRHRGEIEAEIGNAKRTLVLTLGALAELESAFGADDLAALTERFAQGRRIRIRPDRAYFDPRAVVERARSRLGERGYRILTNNCEHFCMWALCNENHSSQVDRLRSAPRVMCRASFSLLQRLAGAWMMKLRMSVT